MSQNPNNSYGPNPSGPGGENAPSSNPNFNLYGGSNPGQGTAYGGSGPDPNYNPYYPNPQSPGTNPDPYGMDPTVQSTNPYHPYAQPSSLDTNPYSYGSPTGTAVSASNPNQYNSYAPPAPPPLITPSGSPRRPVRLLVLLAVLALLTILGGSIFAVVAHNNIQAGYANAIATAHANGTVIARIVTATSQAIASTYPFSVNKQLDDPLTDNSKGNGWQSSNACSFIGSAYHVVDTQNNTYETCFAQNTDFNNFTYEVQMTIIKGDSGGLIFRAEPNNNKFYRLSIHTDGYWGIFVSVDTSGSNVRVLKEGTTNLVATGYNRTNTIAIVARGNQISLYINQQLVDSVTDSTFSHGQIGVSATNLGQPTEVAYSNTKVWTL